MYINLIYCDRLMKTLLYNHNYTRIKSKIDIIVM